MPTLRELQDGFRRYLLGGGAEDIAGAVTSDALHPEQRLGIYRNHVRISLREALKANHPTVASLVGEDFFAALARAFIEAHPPQGPCLHEYGEDLPAYIEAYVPARSVAYLGDVARLDWSLNASFHSAEMPPIGVTALAEIAPERYGDLRLILQPSLRFLRSRFPLERIWQVAQPDAPEQARADLSVGGVDLEIRRRDDRAIFTPLGSGAWRWRKALAEGASLGDSVMALAGDAAFDLNAELPAVFAAGLVCAVAVAP